MEVPSSSKKLETAYETTWCHNGEGQNVNVLYSFPLTCFRPTSKNISKECKQNFIRKTRREDKNFEDLGVDVRPILPCILKE